MKCNIPQRRFQMFTDDEVYMLSRHAIESSEEILMNNMYTDAECDIHGELLNELLTERKLREGK